MVSFIPLIKVEGTLVFLSTTLENQKFTIGANQEIEKEITSPVENLGKLKDFEKGEADIVQQRPVGKDGQQDKVRR